MLEQETPYIIVVLVLLSIIGAIMNEQLMWNDPSAPYIIIFIMMLIISSIVIGRKYGLIPGLLALTWPSLLEIVHQYINKEKSVPLKIIPVVVAIIAQFIWSLFIFLG